MKKWEYFTDYDLTQKELNAYGIDGWELVSVYVESCQDFAGLVRFVFKKELNA